jgi:Fic family protein
MEKYNDLIVQIEAIKLYFEKLDIHLEIKKNILRNSLLKSARFSSKIENADSKLEIDNLFKAYLYITSKKTPKFLSLNLIKQLHQIILNDINHDAGNLRNEPCAIYNTAGVAVYLAPPSQKLKKLLEDLITEANHNKDHPLIKAAIFQFKFEKIHPFLDGNGRIGRLISYLILYQNSFSFNGYLSPEEYINKYREIYYDCLEPNANYQPFVKFFLESILNQLKTTFNNLKNPDDLNSLLPRRREIYEIIKDHPNCSFNFIHRRFMKVNPKTLHYDLSKLQKNNLITKVGISRGVTYVIKQ